MAKAKKEAALKPKKLLRKEVASTLAEVFPDIKQAIGEKKFNKKVKKASKLLISGTVIKLKKEKPLKKKAEKATVVKAEKPAKKNKKAGKKGNPAKKENKAASAVITEVTNP